MGSGSPKRSKVGIVTVGKTVSGLQSTPRLLSDVMIGEVLNDERCGNVRTPSFGSTFFQRHLATGQLGSAILYHKNRILHSLEGDWWRWEIIT